MKQAPRFDGLLFDPFSLFQDGLAASEVDIGRGEVLQALMVAVTSFVVAPIPDHAFFEQP